MTGFEKIVDKVQKLKRHAESAEAIGNELEAQAFAEAFQRLMTEHKINMTDIEFAAQEVEDPVGTYPIDYERYPDIKVRKTRIEWIEKLGVAVAEAHFCRLTMIRGTTRFSLIGRKQDAAVAEYMIITLQRAAESLASKAHMQYIWEVYKKDRNTKRARGFKESYLRSFVIRLIQRYHEERNRHTGQHALVRINKSVQAVKDFMDAAMAAKQMTTAPALKKKEINWNSEGHMCGVEAANKIALDGKAIATQPEAQKSITSNELILECYETWTSATPTLTYRVPVNRLVDYNLTRFARIHVRKAA